MAFNGKIFCLAVALVALWSGTALAQTGTPSLPPVPETLVKQLSSAARAQLPSAKLPDGSGVRAETREELSRAIVPAALDSQTVARGILSGQMQHCGTDWAGVSFTPYMSKLRASRRYSAKQLAYVGLLHGVAQGVMSGALRERGQACTAQASTLLTRMAAEAPIATP